MWYGGLGRENVGLSNYRKARSRALRQMDGFARSNGLSVELVIFCAAQTLLRAPSAACCLGSDLAWGSSLPFVGDLRISPSRTCVAARAPLEVLRARGCSLCPAAALIWTWTERHPGHGARGAGLQTSGEPGAGLQWSALLRAVRRAARRIRGRSGPSAAAAPLAPRAARAQGAGCCNWPPGCCHGRSPGSSSPTTLATDRLYILNYTASRPYLSYTQKQGRVRGAEKPHGQH
jgi:hypothetical protein